MRDLTRIGEDVPIASRSGLTRKTMNTEIHDLNSNGLKKAVAFLSAGKIVALPTETVYGLAAVAGDANAVGAISSAKSRLPANPYSVAIFYPEQAHDFADISPLAQSLMEDFWPGPLTLVLPKRPSAPLSPSVNPDLETVGLRLPDMPWISEFQKLGFAEPLVLTSANRSGEADPESAQDVLNSLAGYIPFILDGGACKTGIASTVLKVEDRRSTVLRVGTFAPEALAAYAIDGPGI